MSTKGLACLRVAYSGSGGLLSIKSVQGPWCNTRASLAAPIWESITVTTLLAFDKYRKRLEVRCARHAERLQATSLQLEQFRSTIFHDVRALVGKMRSYANSLLDAYGGFLPRQGQEKAQRIEHEAGQMIRLLDDLFKDSPSGNSVKVVDARSLQRLSA